MKWKKRPIYTADFETNNSEEAEINRETYVWLWDICKDDLSHITGETIDEFFDELEELESCIIYFHNLKFDGNFMLSYLLKEGYKWTKERKLKKGEFTSLITEKKQWYSLKVKIGKTTIEFRDSSKKLVGSVDKIAKDYGLIGKDGKALRKLEIDYKLDRKGVEVTQEEIEYIRHDTEIIERVILSLHEEGLDRLTTSSDALNSYKNMIGEDVFKALFPVLSYEDDSYCRKSYRGGLCIVNNVWKGKVINQPVNTFDENSMYPDKMRNYMLPYGVPMKGTGKPSKEVLETHPLFIQHCEVAFELKSGMQPFILIKGGIFNEDKYIETTEGQMLELWLTSVDLELLFSNYDVEDIKYLDYMAFKGSKKLFAKYVDYYYEIKNTSTGSKKANAKLMLNGLYGKFAMNPVRYVIEPYLENNVVCYRTIDKVIDECIATHVSCFITAWSRYDIGLKINQLRDDFIYCDTDSIHTVASLEKASKIIPIDEGLLGYWKHENVFKKSKYLAQKTYYGITVEDKNYVKVCGCPESVKSKIEFKDFCIGSKWDGKLMPKVVNGGVILVDATFTLKPR